MRIRHGPKLDYRPSVRFEQATKRRQGKATNVSRVSLDTFDERCRATLDREGSGLVEWFTGFDVPLNLVVARAPEVNHRCDGFFVGDPASGINQDVPCEQGP